MIIEIFELLPGARLLDPDRPVALVHVPAQGPERVEELNPRRGQLVRDLFENDFSSFVAEGDVVAEHKAWSHGAIEQILKEELYSFSLAGRIRAT